MSHEHELMTQLRDARKARAKALAEEEDAALLHAEKRAARRKTEADIEEILGEIETGKSTRPIIDHINGRSSQGSGRPEEEEDAADGPDYNPADLYAETGAAIDRAEAADINVEWTSADLDRELAAACYMMYVGPNPWTDLQKAGCDDAKILEVLRAIWPAGYLALGGTGPWKGRAVGKTIHGGPTPAFWVGARKNTDWKVAPPQRQGLQLADRVRTVLGIPQAPVPAGPEPVAAGKPARKPRGKEAVTS